MLPVLSAGVATDHRHHHAGRGDPEDTPASEARGRPAPDFSGACPPRSLCLVLRLTVRDGEWTRLRPLQWGGTKQPWSDPPPAVSPRTARVCGGRRSEEHTSELQS